MSRTIADRCLSDCAATDVDSARDKNRRETIRILSKLTSESVEAAEPDPAAADQCYGAPAFCLSLSVMPIFSSVDWLSVPVAFKPFAS